MQKKTEYETRRKAQEINYKACRREQGKGNRNRKGLMCKVL
jgi:hypothetical protein